MQAHEQDGQGVGEARRCSTIYCFDASGDGAGRGRWRTTRIFDAVRKLAWERFRITFEGAEGTPMDPPFDDMVERVPIPVSTAYSFAPPAPDWADGGLDGELVASLGDAEAGRSAVRPLGRGVHHPVSRGR